MENNKVIGSKIKYLREWRGFKQEEIAKAVGLEISKYNRLENNKMVKIDEDLLKKIADELGVTVADIKSPAPAVFNFNLENGTQIGHNENYYETQKDLYEKIISDKEKEVERLIKLNEQLMKLLERK
ncbi:MAG: helix-turn-helix transcriptional regulator [Chitinophagaceae bacterium]|nr:helix-turn-helix transcriptional regulator [Chitinophagaceae bacterium]